MMIRHELACSEDRFWAIHFDRSFNMDLHASLGFPKWELVEEREDGDRLVQTIQATPRLDVPGPIAGLVGPSFSYREEGAFDRKARVYTFVMKTPLEERLGVSGTIRSEARGVSSCVRVVEIEVVVKVFVFGGMLEAATEKTLRDGWNRSAVYLNDWLKTHR